MRAKLIFFRLFSSAEGHKSVMWVKTKRLPHDGEGVDTDGAPEVAHCLFANCQPEDGALFEFGKFCNTPEGADLLFDRDSGIGYGNGYGEERPRRSTSGD